MVGGGCTRADTAWNFGYVKGEEGVNKNVDWIEEAKRKSVDVARSLLRKLVIRTDVSRGKNGPLTLYYDTVSSGPGSKAFKLVS